jgi:hypothetical protein
MRQLGAVAIAALCSGFGAAQAPRPDVVVSGKIAHHFLTNDLFRIDTVWMQVAPDSALSPLAVAGRQRTGVDCPDHDAGEIR